MAEVTSSNLVTPTIYPNDLAEFVVFLKNHSAPIRHPENSAIIYARI